MSKKNEVQRDSDILETLPSSKEIRNDASEQEIINRVFRCGEAGNSYARIFILTVLVSLIYSPLFPKLTNLDSSLLLPLRILSVLIVSFVLFYDYKKRA